MHEWCNDCPAVSDIPSASWTQQHPHEKARFFLWYLFLGSLTGLTTWASSLSNSKEEHPNLNCWLSCLLTPSWEKDMVFPYRIKADP